MTYIEWRDELKNNLLSVSDEERRRVLDYYSEAYADRRDAGYSEDQIIQDFGAPYDAAQRILLNICDNEYGSEFESPVLQKTEENDKSYEKTNIENGTIVDLSNDKKDNKKEIKEKPKTDTNKKSILSILWQATLTICMILLFGFTISITILTLIMPIACLADGIFLVITGIIEACSSAVNGVYSIGEGIMIFGIGVVLIPLCIKLFKLTLKLAKKIVCRIGKIFAKECAV